MKKWFYIIFSLLLSVGVLSLSITHQIRLQALASAGLSTRDASGAAEVFFSPVEVYALAYPGILPDHPLYVVKMVRDRVKLWLTREPLSRSQLLLLYADKRLAASLVEMQKSKIDVAVSTAAKSLNYFDQSADQLQALPLEMPGVFESWQKMRLASEGYELYLLEMKEGVPDGTRTLFDRMIERVGVVREQAEGVVGKPVEASESGRLDIRE